MHKRFTSNNMKIYLTRCGQKHSYSLGDPGRTGLVPTRTKHSVGRSKDKLINNNKLQFVNTLRYK